MNNKKRLEIFYKHQILESLNNVLSTVEYKDYELKNYDRSKVLNRIYSDNERVKELTDLILAQRLVDYSLTVLKSEFSYEEFKKIVEDINKEARKAVKKLDISKTILFPDNSATAAFWNYLRANRKFDIQQFAKQGFDADMNIVENKELGNFERLKHDIINIVVSEKFLQKTNPRNYVAETLNALKNSLTGSEFDRVVYRLTRYTHPAHQKELGNEMNKIKEMHRQNVNEFIVDMNYFNTLSKQHTGEVFERVNFNKTISTNQGNSDYSKGVLSRYVYEEYADLVRFPILYTTSSTEMKLVKFNEKELENELKEQRNKRSELINEQKHDGGLER